jgi:hypothetical protein
MDWRRNWLMLLVGVGLLSAGGCTVPQQQKVLGSIGSLIPGSSNSIITSSSSPAPSEQAAPAAEQPKAAPLPDPEKVDAQWVLRTMQRAMTDDPAPFQECLDNPPCKIAFTAHLIRLQKLAGGTLDLPAVYDRYDLKRGKE